MVAYTDCGGAVGSLGFYEVECQDTVPITVVLPRASGMHAHFLVRYDNANVQCAMWFSRSSVCIRLGTAAANPQPELRCGTEIEAIEA